MSNHNTNLNLQTPTPDGEGHYKLLYRKWHYQGHFLNSFPTKHRRHAAETFPCCRWQNQLSLPGSTDDQCGLPSQFARSLCTQATTTSPVAEQPRLGRLMPAYLSRPDVDQISSYALSTAQPDHITSSTASQTKTTPSSSTQSLRNLACCCSSAHPGLVMRNADGVEFSVAKGCSGQHFAARGGCPAELKMYSRASPLTKMCSPQTICQQHLYYGCTRMSCSHRGTLCQSGQCSDTPMDGKPM